MTRLIYVSGTSNSGKTTLIERLIPKLRQRGLKVGTMKHTHKGFEVDREGSDSHRHQEAGALAVGLIGPEGSAFFWKSTEINSAEQMLAHMPPHLDLVLAEGFKQAEGCKIVLGSSADAPCSIQGEHIQVSVLPDQLTKSDWDLLIQFCQATDAN